MYNLSSSFQEESKGKLKKKGWRLFHAKDFQSLMHPCLTFCRILGVFPYKVNASTFEASRPHYILSIIVICVCNIYALITLYDCTIFGKFNMLELPGILYDKCCLVLNGFIMIVTFILTGPRIRLLKIIMKISSRLPTEPYEKLSKLIHTKDIIGFLCFTGIILLSIFTMQIHCLFRTYINLVVLQMDMLYMNSVCILKACFKRINDDLAHMREVITNNEPRVPRLICHEQRSPFLIMELKALKKQHLTISDTVQMLNMIFSLQLLATIVMISSQITLCLYSYTWLWINLPSMGIPMDIISRIIFHVFFLLYIAYVFIKIGLIVWACETGKNQALQIGTSIHDVFNCTTDEQIKDELQLFSLQILHCNNTFSTKGFTVDAKLLTRIVGSTTTYVLILFQFMSMSCEYKTGEILRELHENIERNV